MLYNNSNKLEKVLKMKKVLVVTQSDLLFQKIKLALRGLAECHRHSQVNEDGDFDLCFLEAPYDGKAPVGAVKIGVGDGCDLTLPLSISDIRRALEERKDNGNALTLDEDTRTVRFKGRTSKLTELEFALLSLLLSERGRSFTGEEILQTVWGDEANRGIVNVYIHYLREKLECDGERVIISSRKSGYKIDERFLGEVVC